MQILIRFVAVLCLLFATTALASDTEVVATGFPTVVATCSVTPFDSEDTSNTAVGVGHYNGGRRTGYVYYNAAAAKELCQVDWKIGEVGNVDAYTYYTEVWAVTGDNPPELTGTALCTSDPVDGDQIPGTWDFVQFDFATPCTLPQSTERAIVVTRLGTNATNYIELAAATTANNDLVYMVTGDEVIRWHVDFSVTTQTNEGPNIKVYPYE